MSHRKFTSFCPWTKYSKKLISAIEHPRHAGFFLPEDALSKGMQLISIEKGSFQEGAMLGMYLLIDPSDGIIADAKFQVFGPSALIGALEAACAFLVRKTCAQMSRLSADLLDMQLRDQPDLPAFSEASFSYLNVTLEAIEELLAQCQDWLVETPLPSTVIQEPNSEEKRYPGWDLLSKEEQISLIEKIVATDIRPYIELDAGGIHIVDLIDGKELIIAYQGACTTCYSATGATLNAIQSILRSQIADDLIVTPDLSFFGQTEADLM